MSESLASPPGAGRVGVILLLLGSAVAAAAGGAALVLLGQERAAGAVTVLVLAALVAAGRAARGAASPRLLFADSAVERIAHAALLASVAWARLPEEARMGAAALIALVTSYLASYLRTRAVGLGFDVEESTLDRGVLLGALALGLLTGFVEVGLWVAVAWSGAVTVKRAFEVASQGEPG